MNAGSSTSFGPTTPGEGEDWRLGLGGEPGAKRARQTLDAQAFAAERVDEHRRAVYSLPTGDGEPQRELCAANPNTAEKVSDKSFLRTKAISMLEDEICVLRKRITKMENELGAMKERQIFLSKKNKALLQEKMSFRELWRSEKLKKFDANRSQLNVLLDKMENMVKDLCESVVEKEAQQAKKNEVLANQLNAANAKLNTYKGMILELCKKIRLESSSMDLIYEIRRDIL